MKTTARDIVRAAVEAAVEELKKHGLDDDVRKLPRLFGEVLGGAKGLVSATLVTPTGDAGAAKAAVLAVLEEKFGPSVQLTERADPKLIGGAVLLIGDKRIDMSVQGALQEAASALRGTHH
jgi:F0F1-type ATP synthase delta subunit